ncbi:MAG: DUF5683 domain-containing protein [Paludibacter sp.]|nr:DUF5683 domain-containing protein [Paludibacter sp.]
MKLFANILIFIFVLFPVKGLCQIADTIPNENKKETIVPDIKKTAKKEIIQQNDTVELKAFKPDPIRVLWMGAIVPGYGQIINRKYWKLPIVYAGFLGLAYTITWNSVRYQAYKNAYRDIIDTDETTNSFLEILPKGYTVNTYGGISAYTNVLNSGMEKFRYNRDLSVIISIAYYGLTLVDAFVDAQLYDFDISTDLSLNLRPALLVNPYGQRNTLGVQFCLNLK